MCLTGMCFTINLFYFLISKLFSSCLHVRFVYGPRNSIFASVVGMYHTAGETMWTTIMPWNMVVLLRSFSLALPQIEWHKLCFQLGNVEEKWEQESCQKENRSFFAGFLFKNPCQWVVIILCDLSWVRLCAWHFFSSHVDR